VAREEPGDLVIDAVSLDSGDLDFVNVPGDVRVRSLYIAEGSTVNLGGTDLYYVCLTGSPTAMVNGMATQVPEPAAMGLLAMGGLALLRRRRA